MENLRGAELRIGNLVNYQVGTSIFQDKVTAITEKRIVIGNVAIKHDCLRPIPLTEEWLINFGFKEVLGKFVIKATDGYNVCVGLRNEKWYLYNDDCDAECNIICEVESVHRLQNLFFDIWNIELKSKG